MTKLLRSTDGTNRATGGQPQIAASNDLDALRAWLARFTDTNTTFENYRKEAERLLLWSIVQLGKPLSSLTHEDLLVHQHFLADPQPTTIWTAGGGRKHPRTDARWRPFYGPLAASSQRQAMMILNVMFAWLVQAGYLAGNPLSLSRQRARRAPPRITRHLEPELWQAVKTYIESMPRGTAREGFHHARVRWLFTLLYLGGLRITEVSANTMGRFFSRRDAGGRERWWLEVTGKGDRERLVPATTEMMVELTRYRRAHDLSALPLPGEHTPLVLPVGEAGKPLTRAALHKIVKEVFAGAASCLRAVDNSNEERASRLEQASAHWLRPIGFDTARVPTWPISRWICGWFATTWDTPRSRRRASISTSTTIGATAKLRRSIGSNGTDTHRSSMRAAWTSSALLVSRRSQAMKFSASRTAGLADMTQFERVVRRWIWSRRQSQALLGVRSSMFAFTGHANNSTFPPLCRYTVRTLYQVGQPRHVSERRGTEVVSCETPLAEWASDAGHAWKKTLPDRRIVQPPGGHISTTKQAATGAISQPPRRPHQVVSAASTGETTIPSLDA